MRKILLTLIALTLLLISGLIIYKGANIGNFEIWGIKQIAEENKKIDNANNELTNLVEVEFPNAVKMLNTSGETMQETKKQYEEQAVLVSNSKYYMQTEKYKLEFLWTRIGNYAKDNKVTPKMEVTTGSTKGVYNLIITVVGKYQKVADFIYAIENDSRLGFKIEDFSMTQYNTDENTNLVQGKFTCKEIKIDIKSVDTETTTAKSTTDKAQANTETNTTNATNNTNTTNTTSSTNTTDTTNSINTVDDNTTTNAENTVDTTTT